MDNYWKPGDSAVLRGVFNARVWAAQAVRVVKDTPTETVLLLVPGAECAFPEGYFRWGHGDFSHGTRWSDSLGGAWQLRRTHWQTNRFLMLLEPGRYYATEYIWEAATGAFRGYYVNFQLPFRRTRLGFDTLDLDLDLVVDSSQSWELKDTEDYDAGLQSGGIEPAWSAAIAQAQPAIIAAIEARQYPFDGAWLNWRPPAEWQPPTLPAEWQTAAL